MAVVIDSDLVPEEDRIDYWSSEVARTFFNPVQVRPAERSPFRRRMLAHSLGHVRVFRLTGTPSLMARTPETISAFDPEYVSLMIQAAGRCWQRQGERMSWLAPGDAVIHDSSSPFMVQNYTPFEVLIFAFPRALLSPHAERVCARTAVRVPHGSGAGSLAVPFLRRVGDALEANTIPEDDVNIGETVLHLIKALYLDPPAVAPAREVHRSEELMRSIQSSIVRHLADPELSPEMIARATYISTSYLHKLFQKHEGMSMGDWVRATRLRRCRRDLTDPALADRRIIDIALSWGFQSASHFSRAFRSEFGCSPRQLRRSARHD